MYTNLFQHDSICVRLSAPKYICIYIYTDRYIHMYMYIYIYICVHSSLLT